MTNQNWYLQHHYHSQSGTNAVQFTNLNNDSVTDDNGQTVAVTEANFPVYRLVMKVAFATNQMGSTSYLQIRFGGNSSQWDNSTKYIGTNTTNYGSQEHGNDNHDVGYSRVAMSLGQGCMGSEYTYYAWGSQVTVDGTTVESYDKKRWSYTNLDFCSYHQNTNWFPGATGSTASCYNGTSAANVTGQSDSGAWNVAMGGTTATAAFSDIYVNSSYNMFGDFLVYRSGIGNYVGGS